MTIVYDNWERLVLATLKRDEIWQICHEHSRTPSSDSASSGASPEWVSKVTPKTSSERISSLNQNNQGARTAEFKKAKPLKRGKSSGMRLDRWVCTRRTAEFKKAKSLKRGKSSGMRLHRWVWTRWLSNTFRAQLTVA